MTTTETRPKISNFYHSPIGKKLITGITGLGLTIFVIFHATGNLLLLINPEAYNQLAHFIDNLGILLYLVELVLLVAVIFHAIMGVILTINNRRSRTIGYQKFNSAGVPSKQSLSSRSMIFTGLTLLTFLVFHLLNFKFGKCDLVTINGIEMRDLSKLVLETFQQPTYVVAYSGVMLFLGLHLRHGIWSGLQSLGLMNSRWSSLSYGVTSLGAILIALGFILIPIVIYLS
ncbi:MAG TPA: succinate dehydrogenase cytochrome b subunit [Xenococcaceae cyanobacterium]